MIWSEGEPTYGVNRRLQDSPRWSASVVLLIFADEFSTAVGSHSIPCLGDEGFDTPAAEAACRDRSRNFSQTPSLRLRGSDPDGVVEVVKEGSQIRCD